MRRALFTREFRSALLPNLVTIGAILATLVVVERVYGLRLGKTEGIREFIDFVLMAGLVTSGLISGERCFPAELKESRILFLSSLPISRSWVWLSIVSARLLAALISLALAVALRRPMLTFPESGLAWMKTGLVATLVLFAYLLFFSGGALSALLFRRTLFSYIAGFTILGILLVETFFSCSYVSSVPPVVFANLTQLPDPSPQPWTPAFLSLLLTSFLLGSWRLFVQGEIGNPKRRTRNQLLFGMAMAAYLCVLFCVMASPRIVSAGSNWNTGSLLSSAPDHGIPYSISPDGRYLAVAESTDDRPFLFRVSIVDTQTGHVLGRSVVEGVNRVYWSSSGDILNLVALNNSPLDRWGYLAPATVDWLRLSPDAREISRRRLQGATRMAILAVGRCLAVREEGGQGRIDLLDGASGRSSEIARAPLDGYVEITADGPAALVYFKNTVLPSRAWVVDSTAHEARSPQPVSKVPWVLFQEVSRSPLEAQNALLRRLAGEAPARGEIVLPSTYRLWIFDGGPEVKGVYFLEESTSGSYTLWARPTAPEGRWEKLPDLTPNLTHSVTAVGLIPSFIDFSSGIAAFLSKEGNGSFFVYDPQRGVIPEVGRCPPRGKAFLSLGRVIGLKGFLIELRCADAPAFIQGSTHYFEHLPGSQEVRAIGTAATRYDHFSHLYFDEQGTDVWSTINNDVWRSAPGKRDLLLWRRTGGSSPENRAADDTTTPPFSSVASTVRSPSRPSRSPL